MTRNVLFPTLSRIEETPERQSAGVVRAGTAAGPRAGAAAAAALSRAVPHRRDPVGGRWEAAVPAMMLLASVSRGRPSPRRWNSCSKRGPCSVAGPGSWWCVLRAQPLVALGVVAVMRDTATATAIAAGVGIFLVVEALLEVVVVGPGLGIAPGSYWRTALPSWLVLVAAGWLVVGLSTLWSLSPWPAAVASLALVGAVAMIVAAVMWRRGLLARR